MRSGHRVVPVMMVALLAAAAVAFVLGEAGLAAVIVAAALAVGVVVLQESERGGAPVSRGRAARAGRRVRR